MAKNIIQHCGKRIPTEREMVVNNFPGFGDTRYLYQATCQVCKNNAFAFWTRHFAGGETELEQADKKDRERFETLISEGRALLVEESSENNRQLRGKSHASQYTLTVSRPVESTLSYVNKIEKGLPELVEFIQAKRRKGINPGKLVNT